MRPGTKLRKPRAFRIKRVGAMIVDLLTPVYALGASHRVIRLDDGPVKEKMVAAMLARLLHALQIKISGKGMLRGVVEVVPLDELEQRLQKLAGWWT